MIPLQHIYSILTPQDVQYFNNPYIDKDENSYVCRQKHIQVKLGSTRMEIFVCRQLKPMQAKFGGREQFPGRRQTQKLAAQRAALGREARGEEDKNLPPALHTLSVQGGGEPVPT